MDSEDEDQMQIREGSKLLKTPIEGDIKLEGIDFKYDSRHTSVFEGFNFQIKKGTKVAFVGASGCGKSTVFQLLQRFYFPQKGKISIDGLNIIDYDIHHLRKSLGVVSQ
jgi:ABC-type bacteriocin/lantibiotic exporter with double-glycine peptidase domain